MYYKIKNTLAGLGVALSLVGVSFGAGHPPTAPSPQATLPAAGAEAPLDELQAARAGLRGMRSQLAMPFYSFATLLPRREG